MDICGHREERFLFTLLPRNVLILVCLGMFADIMNVCECEERSFRLLPQNILILICLGIFADIMNVLLDFAKCVNICGHHGERSFRLLPRKNIKV